MRARNNCLYFERTKRSRRAQFSFKNGIASFSGGPPFFDKTKKGYKTVPLWLIKETWTTREGCCAVFEGKLRPTAAFCSLAIKTIIPRSQSLASKRNFLFKNLRLPAQPFCHDSRQRTQTYFLYVKDDNAEAGQKGEPGAAHHPFLVA